jgi:formate dehydrogenase gamma subunit
VKEGFIKDGKYVRLTLSQRIQHILLFTSFFVLMLTGLPLFFPENPIVRRIFFFSASFQLRGLIHRAAAVLLIGLCIYHLGYCLFTRLGHRDLKEMLVRKKDLKDIVGLFLYNIGSRSEKPKFGKFNFKEKFEYWAVVWGSAVMIVTGFMQWYAEAAMIIFPKWALDVARIIHGYEAILAFLAVIIWHFYNVHLHPSVFPMSMVWITGKISIEELKENHPLEYERLVAIGELPPEEPEVKEEVEKEHVSVQGEPTQNPGTDAG